MGSRLAAHPPLPELSSLVAAATAALDPARMRSRPCRRSPMASAPWSLPA